MGFTRAFEQKKALLAQASSNFAIVYGEESLSLTVKTQRISEILQLAGIAAFATAMVLSLSHYAIGALFVGGVAAFTLGKKLRSI